MSSIRGPAWRITDHCSVTVIANNYTTTDGISTGISVMGPEAGLKFVEQLPGVAALIVREPDDKRQVFEINALAAI